MNAEFVRLYFTHMGIYGAGTVTLSWFMGWYNRATIFFESNRPVCLLALGLHAIAFWTHYAATKELEALRMFRREHLVD